MKEQENQRSCYNRKCKNPVVYRRGQLVAIKKTQFETGAKLKSKFLRPYAVIKVLNHNRYEVKKVGYGEGSRITTSSADNMKSWDECEDGSSGSEIQ